MGSNLQNDHYDPACRDCGRLAAYLDAVRAEFPTYHCRPVPSFGDPDARLLIVGLAPGKHGANASGRPFTGDHAGILLYQTLHKFGFASHSQSHCVNDGLVLNDCRITNAVKCLPPENKPNNDEIRQCNRFLQAELLDCRPGSVVLALGGIAHKAVLKALSRKQVDYPFSHNQAHTLSDDVVLLDSYHCSRYNTQTGRLTESMFEDVFVTVRRLLGRQEHG